MKEITRRKFWQFHLLTFVISMLLVGWLMGVQFVERVSYDNTYPYSPGWIERRGWIECGWPFPLYQEKATVITRANSDYANKRLYEAKCVCVNVDGVGFASPLWPITKELSLSGIVLDVIIVITIVAGVAFGSEFLIRRPKVRNK